MSKNLAAALCLLVAFIASPAQSIDGSIVIFFEPDYSCIAVDLETNTPLTLYVYAVAQGSSIAGIQGAEYRISASLETDWFFQEDFSPSSGVGAVILGSAMGGATPGVNIAFPTCQTAPLVLLQQLTVLDVTGVFESFPNTLTVEAHTNPGNPYFRCPLFNLCDDPAFTKVCLGSNITTEQCPFPPGALACLTSTSGEFYINPGYCYCCISVESSSWSQVKHLFR